ncbi:hypothetical protein LCGC14_2669610, partial [marine sediment metagenome]
GNITKTMREVGYSENTINTPKNLTNSKGFKELMEKNLPNELLTKKHKALLNSKRIEHLVFPVKTEDKAIVKLLNSVNCTVRKIQHGETAKHVWFWSQNDRALKDGLDMAYKLKGKYAPTKSIQLKVERKIIDPEILESEQQYNELIKRKLIERSKVRDKTDS